MAEPTDDGSKRKREKKDKKRKHKHESHRKHHKHKRERKDKDSDRHRERPHKRKKKRRHSGSGNSRSSSGSSGSDDDEPRERKRARASSPSVGPPLPTRPPPPTHRQPAASAPPPARAMAAGKGGGLSAYLRCLLCSTESSSESSFKQHLCGKPHMRANGGKAGFAGLAANSAGVIPPLHCPALRYHAAKMGLDPDGSARGGGSTAAPLSGARLSGIRAAALYLLDRPARPPAVWQPPLRSIAVTPAAEAALKAALSGATERRAQNAQGYLDGAAEGGGPRADARANGARRLPRPMPPPPPVVRGGGPHAASRRALPVYEARSELIAALAQPSCIVEGETGSGKTTQVPQYLLEAAAEAGDPVSIICTQPRRISAISVAERVASERGERVGAGAVGYAVRGESRQGASTSLLFCTTGVLLRMLEDDPHLIGISHVLVDEVHAQGAQHCGRVKPNRSLKHAPARVWSRCTSGRSRVTSSCSRCDGCSPRRARRTRRPCTSA